MKKKFLLAVLPTLLVLSACQAAPKSEDKNIFLEDTLAHEELFNENGFGDLKKDIRKLDPIEHPDVAEPAIGVQYKVDGNNVSFRFVAAVSITSAQLEPTVAKWTRTVSKPDGTDYVKNTAQFECQTVYTSLSADGDPYTITQFNIDHSTSYTHFVVYTLRNIPAATYGDYYVSAYLTLSEGATLVSKAVAINVERTQSFTYDPEMGVSFLRGTIGGVANKVVKATTIRTNANEDKATFKDLSLSANDSFVICELYQTKLYVKNTANFTGDNNGSSNYFTNDSNKMKVTYAGKYDLYLNKSDQIYTSASNVCTNGYLYVDVDVSWWGNDSAWTAVYAYKGSRDDNTGKWYTLASQNWGNKFSTHSDDAFFTSEMYEAGYTTIAVCRLKTGTNIPTDKTQWDSSITHNIYTVSIKTNGIEDCVYLRNNVDISMGSH